MNGIGGRPSFFELRWELFCTAETFRQIEDTECLRYIQNNLVHHELRRIAAATETLGAEVQGISPSDFFRR